MKVNRFNSNFWNYQLMLIPGLILTVIFSIYPMFGIQIAFKSFQPVKGIWGSPWVGWENFQYAFNSPESRQILINTVVIALAKMIMGLIVPIFFALMLNEIRIRWFKRTVQTIVYLPHFLSWVILAGIVKDLLSLDGLVNHFLSHIGLDPIMFLGSNNWFRPILVGTDVWKEFGFSTIIYLAALTSINPSLYEAAVIDGATRMQRIRFITLPGISTTVFLLATLSLQGILNAGFDQVFNLYNTLVYDSGDIIDTYVFRAGLYQAQYELGTAIGLAKSVISTVLIVITYRFAYKYANYRIF